MDVTIRPVRPADAAAIADLLNRIVDDGGPSVVDTPISVDEQVDFIRSFPERGIFNVALAGDDRTIIGLQDIMPLAAAVTGTDAVGDISTFVMPDLHRHGIGTQLGQATVQAARERGFTTLKANIRADNAGAVSFYRSLGFRVVGLAPEPALVRGEPVDILVATASIAPGR